MFANEGVESHRGAPALDGDRGHMISWLRKGMRQFCRNFVVHAVMPAVNFLSARCYVQYRPDCYAGSWKELAILQKEWEQGSRGTNRGDYARMYFMVANIKALEKAGIPGAVAELGVFTGTTAKLLQGAAPHRDLYLFDTFEGFPEIHAGKDPSGATGGTYACSLEQVRTVVGSSPHVHYCKGVFPATTTMVPPGTMFSFVHLDCDLYAPMSAALRFFYPRMAPGGMMVIHDYWSGCWQGVEQAVDEFLRDKQEGLVLVPDKSGTAVLVRCRR